MAKPATQQTLPDRGGATSTAVPARAGLCGLAVLLVAWLGLTTVVLPGTVQAATSTERANAASARLRQAQQKQIRQQRLAARKRAEAERARRAAARKVAARKAAAASAAKQAAAASRKSAGTRAAGGKVARKAAASKKVAGKTVTSKRRSGDKAVATATASARQRTTGGRGAASASRGPRPTLGTAFGLHDTADPLGLRSSVAYVVEPATGRILVDKNSSAVLPIASITKLMTAIVVLDAGQSMREMLRITSADVDRLRNSGSRLPVGTRLTRAEMLQLALMSSANRAAHALGRNYPGGLRAFVSAMNAKAMMFGMVDTRFDDPTGLSGGNVSSAVDLARLVEMASQYPKIRAFSTASGLQVDTGYRRVRFGNTNRLIANRSWDIGLQKTGYISEAGRCLVMRATIGGRDVVMVLLDSNGSRSRFADAARIRKWLRDADPQMIAAGNATTIN